MHKVVALLVLLLGLHGCAVEPWVKPYERAYLSEEVMKLSRDPVSDAYFIHVYQARESARGAEGGEGGGCGCN